MKKIYIKILIIVMILVSIFYIFENDVNAATIYSDIKEATIEDINQVTGSDEINLNAIIQVVKDIIEFICLLVSLVCFVFGGIISKNVLKNEKYCTTSNGNISKEEKKTLKRIKTKRNIIFVIGIIFIITFYLLHVIPDYQPNVLSGNTDIHNLIVVYDNV